MKKVLFFLLAGMTVISANAQVTLSGYQAGQTYSFTTSLVSGGPLAGINPYTWSKNSGDADLTLSGATDAAAVNVAIAAGAANGDQAEFQVEANTTTCSSVPQIMTVIVGNASFTASVAGTNTVCQNDAASVAVTFTKTNGASTITGFSYYIDADNSGTRNGTEALMTGTSVNDGALTGSITLTTSTYGTQNIIISSVSGTLAAATLVAVVPNTVKQVVTINEIPVLSPIIAN